MFVHHHYICLTLVKPSHNSILQFQLFRMETFVVSLISKVSIVPYKNDQTEALFVNYFCLLQQKRKNRVSKKATAV